MICQRARALRRQSPDMSFRAVLYTTGEVNGLISLVTVATATSSVANRTSIDWILSVVPLRKV
jgi:hypothetical protein